MWAARSQILLRAAAAAAVGPYAQLVSPALVYPGVAAASAGSSHQQQQQHQHQQHQQQQHQSMQGQSSPTGSGKHSPATSITSVGSNPHGIDTILSRPAATHPSAAAQAQHAMAASPHAQHLPPAPRYAMHAGFAASTG